MVRLEVRSAAPGDGIPVPFTTRMIKGFAVECSGRAQLGGRLPGIKRRAGRITIYIDDRTGNRRADHRSAESGREIVELLDPPIRILACEPGGHEAGLELRR